VRLEKIALTNTISKIMSRIVRCVGPTELVAESKNV